MLKALWAQLRELLMKRSTLIGMTATERLYAKAKSLLGTDASPDDEANDRFGCADSVSQVIQSALPEYRFPTLLSTADMLRYLQKSVVFQEVDAPVAGAVIISATGTGNGNIKNGHVGIVGVNPSPDGTTYIMSNNSFKGTWEADWTVASWTRYYKGRGGFSIHYFLAM